MANNYLRGVLGFKGERGYSAYEIAVQNGYIGDEKSWLATQGKTNHLIQNKAMYITTEANENELPLPKEFTSDSFLDVYIEGNRLDSSMYSINTDSKKVELTTSLEVVGTKVEMVVVTMNTNSLPIVDVISNDSTNETVPGTKAVYDFLDSKFKKIVETVEILPGKFERVYVSYPDGFSKDNSVLISKSYYYDNDSYNYSSSPGGITLVSMTDENILVVFNNSSKNNTITKYELVLMKI